MRVLAPYRGWEEPLASEPAGVVIRGDKRPLLGRTLHGKSQQELQNLGLLVEDETPPETPTAGGAPTS